MTWWVVAVLRDAGVEPVVIDARQFKLISHSKKKNDKHDARALADALRGGLAQRYSVHVPSDRARRGRALLRTRHQVVKQSVASWNAARGTFTICRCDDQ
jgi:transposase